MGRREKIAIILFGDYIFDGRVQRCAEALAERYEVKVFVTTDYSEDYPTIFRGIDIEFIPLKSKNLPKHPFVQILKFIEYFAITAKHIKKYNPDYIHCNDVFTILFGLMFYNQKVVVYDSHELWKDTQHMKAYNKNLFKIMVFIEKIAIKKVRSVITVNDHIADILRTDHDIELPTVIRNIADYDEIENSDIVRERCGLSKNEKIVLYIGGFSSGRGLQNVVKSFQYVDDHIVMVFVGNGYLNEELIILRDSLQLNNRIFFLDPISQDEVLKYEKSSDLGIISYENTCLNHYYCLPNKFFQFVQMGKPLIVSNFPELKEKVEEYQLGYIFDPDSIEDIAKSINKIFSNDFSIKEENLYKFLNKYNWENEKKKLLLLYSTIGNNE
ncbi:MAG: glycosyltransferase [Candidatus Tenebribacter davisii]|nr:glycosyltransferase [Candidatus Tenebribacter davisii]